MTTATIEAPTAFRVIATRDALADALGWAKATIPSRTPKPCLAGVLIETTESGILVRATNLEQSVRIETEQVQIEQRGRVLVNAERLAASVARCEAETLAMELGDNGLTLKWNGTKLRLETMAPADFPPELTISEPVTFAMPLAVLKRMLGNVAGAVSDKPASGVFNGLLIDSDGSHIITVGADSRRMHVDREPLEADKARVLIPRTMAAMLLKLEEDEHAAVVVALGANQAGFEYGDITLSTCLIEGEFPQYENFIPKDCNRKLTIARDELARVVSTASVMTSEETKGIRVSLSAKGLSVSAATSGVGEATVVSDCRYEGEPLEIGLNPAFLADAIRNAGEEITVELTAANRPILVRDGTEYKAIVMPVNINA